MLSLRRETEYAVWLLRSMSKRGNTVSLKDLSDEIDVSFLFLQKIARKLRFAGLIKAAKGVNGGYRLAVPARQLTLGKILSVTEGDCCLLPCLGKSNFKCNKKSCCLKDKVGKLNEQVIKMMDKIKLSDL